MTPTEKILAEFDELLSHFKSSKELPNTAVNELRRKTNTQLEAEIRSFLTSKIAQAEKSGKDRMREALGCICKNLAPASVHFKDCPLGKCHQALDDLKPIISNILK